MGRTAAELLKLIILIFVKSVPCWFYSLTKVDYTVIIHFKLRFNIFLSSTSKSLKWALSIRCFHQNPVGTSVPSQENHITLQSHPPRFDPLNITFDDEYKLHTSLLFNSFQPPVYLLSLRSKYFPDHLVSEELYLRQYERPSFFTTNLNTGGDGYSTCVI
jgi:hypothetical protein